MRSSRRWTRSEIRRDRTASTSTSSRTSARRLSGQFLSESCKRGLFLTLAHQFILQLDEEIQDAVLGNCSTIISFRVGPNDAPIIGAAIDTAPRNLRSE